MTASQIHDILVRESQLCSCDIGVFRRTNAWGLINDAFASLHSSARGFIGVP